jgi:hypothetical protein
MEARFLRETLKHGSYRLCDENSMLKERAKTRDRIKWLKQQGSNSENDTFNNNPTSHAASLDTTNSQ